MRPAARLALVVAIGALAAGLALRWSSAGDPPRRARDGAAGSTPVADATPTRSPGTARPGAAPVRPGTSYAALAANVPDTAMPERGPAAPAAAGDASPPVVAPDAARSLADALRNGDERSPPIVADAPAIERASAAELADPAAYRRYEQRSQAKLYRNFEQEAVIALNDMDRDIRRGRAAGVPAELIAEGEEKQRRLAEALEQLRRDEKGGHE